MWAVYHRDEPRPRGRTLQFVEIIAEVVDGRTCSPWRFHRLPGGAGAPSPLAARRRRCVTFSATFGPGFYWFAAYRLFSLFTQQVTARRLIRGRGSDGLP